MRLFALFLTFSGLTHPRLRGARAQAIRQGLLDFSAAPEGQTFLQSGGLAEIAGGELRAFRPYAQQAQGSLRAA